MKKIWLFILWLFVLIFVWNFTQANDYEYSNLYVSANILNDWTIDVKEDFTVNFFVNKHWIIRDIPLNYSVWWKEFHIDVSNIKVAWKTFTKGQNNWNIEIKIWDADRTVIWEQIYPISYSTYWLIRNFSWMWYAELYWNLVWYGFDTNINKVRVEIRLPKKYNWFTESDFLITTDWKTKTVKEFEWTVDWSFGDEIVITYNKKLDAWEGITLSMKFPNDYFEFNHDRQASLIWYVWDNNFALSNLSGLNSLPWKYVLLIWAILWTFLLSAFTIKWKINSGIKKSELEDKIQKERPIVIKYSPPEWVNCAEAGMLYNWCLEPTDLTSLIYKWAVEWLISIYVYGYDSPSIDIEGWTLVPLTNRDTWFLITKLKNIDANCPWYEVEFFRSMFPWAINSKTLVSKASEIDVATSLEDLRNYGKSRWWLTVWWFSPKISCVLVVGILLFVMLRFWVKSEIMAFILIFVCMIFGSLNSGSPTQKEILLTEKWLSLSSEIIWYAKFIQACDEDKLRLFLEQDPAFFDKTLPYAVAFWFESSFIKLVTPILEELDMRPIWLDWEIGEMNSISDTIDDIVRQKEIRVARESEYHSSYDSDSWFDSWSSFFWWWSSFSSWWWGGGWWWRSW